MLLPNTIKTIIFDLDGTLRQQNPRNFDFFLNYVDSIGIQIDEEHKHRALQWEHYYFSCSNEIDIDGKRFINDSKGFWANYVWRRLIILGVNSLQAMELSPQISLYMKEVYSPLIEVPEDAPLLLASLQEKGYTLGIISNRERPYQKELEKLKLDSFFSFAIAAGEIQAYKPKEGIFQKGLELAGSTSAETVYIGDNYYSDVVGSKNIGITPILYDLHGLYPDADCVVVKSFSEIAKIFDC